MTTPSEVGTVVITATCPACAALVPLPALHVTSVLQRVGDSPPQLTARLTDISLVEHHCTPKGA